MTNFAQAQWLTGLNRLTEERSAAVRELGEMVAAQRLVLVGEMDQLSLKVVDHAFWRAAQLIAGAGLAAFVAMVLLLFLVRRLFRQPSIARSSTAPPPGLS